MMRMTGVAPLRAAAVGQRFASSYDAGVGTFEAVGSEGKGAPSLALPIVSVISSVTEPGYRSCTIAVPTIPTTSWDYTSARIIMHTTPRRIRVQTTCHAAMVRTAPHLIGSGSVLLSRALSPLLSNEHRPEQVQRRHHPTQVARGRAGRCHAPFFLCAANSSRALLTVFVHC